MCQIDDYAKLDKAYAPKMIEKYQAKYSIVNNI